MFDFLARAIAFFYDVWPSYGMAIVLFTLAVYLVLTPLTIKSTRSMIAMQRVQPELKKLQAQYKDDKETLQREMMAFYQANNINPFSSCLPLLLQMPIFFVLFQVLNGLTRRNTEGFFVPKYLHEDSALRIALEGTKEMVSWGIDLSRSASTVLSDDGVGRALPFLLLVALTAVTAWYQQKQIQGRNVNTPNQAPPQQQALMKILPFMITFFSFTMPAGVVVYFVVSSMVRIGQQALVTQLEYGGKKGDKASSGSNGAKAKSKATPAAPTAAPAKPEAKPRTNGQGANRARNKKKRR
jgi:YidC/Oxa1 family membrane protein insertase